MKRILILLAVGVGLSGIARAQEDVDWQAQREVMVERQILARGLTHERVLAAMRKVPRHLFVPEAMRYASYDDQPQRIGYDQTISQPFIVAYMTAAVDPKPDDRALEIGTGSGYQAAILAELAKEVYTIEIIEELAEESMWRLLGLGYKNISVMHGDGYKGWKEQAPFDVIVVTAAPEAVPPALLEQLAEGGRMIVPVGGFFQDLELITKNNGEISRKRLIPVKFVPMVEGK